MMPRISWKTVLGLGAVSAANLLGLHSHVAAAPPERPTFNQTADPRPNILPNSLYNHHVPYRLQYNRPTYHVGKALYYVVSPTSQEALVWKENLDECRYEGHNCPPVYKSYFYPKPWEILNTGPRPNFASAGAKPAPVQLKPAPSPVQPIPANTAPKDAEKVDTEAAKKEKEQSEEQAKAKLEKEKSLEKVPAPK